MDKNPMKHRIHFTYPDGTEDLFTVEGETIAEIALKAHTKFASNEGQEPWSEEIEP